MVFDVNKKTLVVQSNSLVQAKYRLSVEEQKIIKILISQIQRDDKDFQNYEFRIRELAEMLGMEHKDPYGVLEKITERLMSRVLKFYNPETKILLQASWLSSVSYKKGEGTVSLRFDPYMKPLLLQLQSYFTKYELGQVMQFKGQYTIRFFEFRKSFLGQNKKEISFSLQDLWEKLGLKKGEYKIFRNFKNRVLEPARLELLEKTGQSFSWESVRQGRGGKIVGVRFVFDGEIERESKVEKETVVALQSAMEQEREKPHIQEQPEQKEELPINQEKREAIKLMLDCGISESVAIQLADKHDTEYIREKIAIANAHPEYVKNKAGFIIKAVQENWIDEDVAKMKREEARLDAEKRASEERKRLRDTWDRYKWKRGILGLKEFEKLADDEVEKIKEEFLGGLNDFLRGIYQKKGNFGYEDNSFKSFFLGKLKLPTFDNFLATEGITISEDDRDFIRREFER